MIKICPHCNNTFTTEANSGDYVHTCNSTSDVLNKEDVVVISVSVTENGATVNTGRTQGGILLSSIQNALQGTYADFAGERYSSVTTRGNRVATTRERQHYEYIPEDMLKEE